MAIRLGVRAKILGTSGVLLALILAAPVVARPRPSSVNTFGGSMLEQNAVPLAIVADARGAVADAYGQALGAMATGDAAARTAIGADAAASAKAQTDYGA